MTMKYISRLMLLCGIVTYSCVAMGAKMQIVTVDNDAHKCLSTKAEYVVTTKEGLLEAKKIADDMVDTLTPLMPAAGLAAPQIDVSKRMFIYSWDRSLEHLDVAINPSFESIDKKIISGWEACFSTILGDAPYKIAFVPRYTKILVTYTTLEGTTKKLILKGFAAKVFQHEYDHLEGIVNVKRSDIEVKSFFTKQAQLDFMTEIKKKDAVHYIAPQEERNK